MLPSRAWGVGLFLLLVFPAWAKDSDQAHDLEQGLAAYRSGDLESALGSFNSALQKDPFWQAAHAARAQAFHALGDDAMMRQDLRSALPMSADNAGAWTLRGTALVLDGSPDRAIEDFNHALQSDARNADAYLGRGRAYRALGDFRKAAADWTSALSINPDLAMAFYDRADAEHRLGDDASAIRDLTQALRHNRRFAAAYAYVGMIFAQQGDFRRALAAYSKAISCYPKYIYPYLGRAAVQLRNGKKDAAMKDYERAIALSPKDYSPYYNRGEALWRMGDKPAALADFSKAAELDVPDAAAARLMADRLEESGKPDAALKLYSQSLEILQRSHDPRQNALIHDFLLKRSRLYAARQESPRAEQDLDEAVRLFPKSAAAWTERGKLYAPSQTAKAARDLEQALSIDPKYTPALVALGKLKAAGGRIQDARKDFDAAIAQDPKSADAYGNRGLANARLGEDDKAFQDLSQAITLAPSDPQWHFHLAVLEMRRRNYRRAAESLGKALSLEPPSPKALEQRAQAYALLGDQEAALKDIHAALEIDPKSGHPYAVSSGMRLRAWQPARAISDLKQAGKPNGDSFILSFNLGVAYGIEEKYAKSADEFRRAADLDPRSAQAYTALCRALRLDKSYHKAERACGKAGELDPKYAMLYIDRGLTRLYLHDFAGAAADLLQGYRLGARYAGAELARSVALAALRQYAESDAAYRSAMDLDPWARDAEIGFGPRVASNGGYSAWIYSFKKQVDRDKDNPATHLVRGNFFANRGDLERAVSEYTDAMQEDGTLAGAYLDRCATYKAQSQMELAGKDCDYAVELAPKDPQARAWLLEAMALTGDYKKGLEDAADALRAVPRSAALFVRAGNLRYFLKDVPRARENYQLALLSDPDFPDGYNGLGLCDLAEGKNPEAAENFSRAIAIDPRNARYYANRAAAYVGLKSYANAAADYRSALATNTNPDAEPKYKRLLDLSSSRISPPASQTPSRTR